jgi:hypothetical protein
MAAKPSAKTASTGKRIVLSSNIFINRREGAPHEQKG